MIVVATSQHSSQQPASPASRHMMTSTVSRRLRSPRCDCDWCWRCWRLQVMEVAVPGPGVSPWAQHTDYSALPCDNSRIFLTFYLPCCLLCLARPAQQSHLAAKPATNWLVAPGSKLTNISNWQLSDHLKAGWGPHSTPHSTDIKKFIPRFTKVYSVQDSMRNHRNTC